MATEQEIIKTFMATLDTTNLWGEEAVNAAIKASSKFESLQDLRSKLISDCTTIGDGEKFLREKCNIILDNEDTGAITGSDAGDGKVKTSESIVPESGDLINFTGNSFTVEGLTFTLEKDFNDLSAKEQFIWQALYTWWAKSSLNLLTTSYGYSFKDSDATPKEITVMFYPSYSKNYLAWVSPYSGNNGKTDRLSLNFNMMYYSNITDENGNSTYVDSDGITHQANQLDLVIGHEMTHAIMAAKINYFSNLPVFLKEGLADLTIGSDKTQGINISYLAKNPSVLENELNKTSSNDYVYSYAAGYIFLRYMAKQSATSYTKTFNGTSDAETFETTNDGVTINGAGGNDSLLNGFYSTSYSLSGGDNVSLNGGADDDYLYNMQGKSVTLLGSVGNDQAHSYQGETITADLGIGNDYFNAHQSKNVTALGGGGDDTLQANYVENFYYDGGAGSDLIQSKGTKSTLIGGADNDTISLLSGSTDNLIIYNAGDGNDLIQGISSTDTLSINGAKATRSTSGSNVIFGIGSSSITVNGGTNVNFTLINAVGETFSNTISNLLFQGSPYDDSLNNSGDSVTVDAGAGNDSIDNSGNNVQIYGGADDDVINNGRIIHNEVIEPDGIQWTVLSPGGKNLTISGDDGNDLIRNEVYEWNEKKQSYEPTSSPDKNTILGGNGEDTIYNFDSFVTIDGGAGNDSIQNKGENVLFKYSLGDENDTISGFNETSTLQIGNGTTDTYSKETSGNNLIVTVGKGKITLVDAATTAFTILGEEEHTLKSVTYDNNSATKVTLGSGIEVGDATARTAAIRIVGNALDNSILGGTGKDSLYGKDGDDYLFGGAGADSIYGQNGNDTLTGGDGADVFIYTAGNDVIADYAADDKISLGAAISKSSIKGSDATFIIGSNTLTVTKGKGKEIVFIDADGNERTIIGGAYLSDDTTTSNVKMSIAWREVVDATARTKAVKVTGNANDNSILGGSGKDTLYGKDGNDYLAGNEGNDKLYGQNGDDTLLGGTGNDTLTGGDGADIFIYTAGNDLIEDYAEGEKISIGAAISKSSIKGSDATFTIGSNTLTVKNGKGAEIAFIESDGTERTIIGGAFVATNSTSTKNTLAAWREVGDASARTNAIYLVGNALDNSILGGSGKDSLYGKDGDDYIQGNAGADSLYGQNGDDTLWGGIGNDTLKGGAGADTFIYNSGEGKDVIVDFSEDDLLKISGDWNASYNMTANTISFKVGSTANALTLKNFTATSFNVNGDTYVLGLVKK